MLLELLLLPTKRKWVLKNLEVELGKGWSEGDEIKRVRWMRCWELSAREKGRNVVRVELASRSEFKSVCFRKGQPFWRERHIHGDN